MKDKSKETLSKKEYLSNLARHSTKGKKISVSDLAEEDLELLLNEFGVYQIELETQNEQLNKTQAQIKQMRDRYRSLYELAPVGYFTLNREGEVREVNLTGCELLGESRSRLLGHPFAAFLSEDDVRDFYLHVRSVIDTQEPAVIELRLAETSAHRCEVIRLESIAVNSERREWLCRTTISDITLLKRAEADLREANIHLERRVEERTAELNVVNDSLCREVAERKRNEEAAEKATQAKSEFLAGMSHEIRTPMTVFLLALQRLGETNIDSEQDELLSMANSSANHLRSLLDDILDYSQIEAQKINIEQHAFEIRSAVKNSVELLRLAAEEKKLSLNFEIDPAVPQTITTDPDRLRQILVNLTGNAIKFTDHGEVKVVVTCDNDWLRFEISDTGPGIAREDQKLLFRNFSQIIDSHQKRQKGTGLGLAISKGLTELMGGTIGVMSKTGAGSTFWFTLPLETSALQDNKAPNEVKNPEQQTKEHKPLQILLAEDEPLIQKLISLLLTKKGHRVVVAEDGQKAVEQWHCENFDLIFLDMHMPVMDGIKTAREIRRLEREKGRSATKIIALTADVRREVQIQCQQAGIDSFLGKPLKIEALFDIIEECASTPKISNSD